MDLGIGVDNANSEENSSGKGSRFHLEIGEVKVNTIREYLETLRLKNINKRVVKWNGLRMGTEKSQFWRFAFIVRVTDLISTSFLVTSGGSHSTVVLMKSAGC